MTEDFDAMYATPVPDVWQTMDCAPETEPMRHIKVLVWGPQTGVRTGSLHRWKGHAPTVNIANLHGDAVEHWGVTHWMPEPAPPIEAVAAA